MDTTYPKSKKKSFLIIAACILVSVILILVLTYKRKIPNSYRDPNREFEVFQTVDEDSIIFIDGKQCDYKIPKTEKNSVFKFDLGMSRLFVLNQDATLYMVNNLKEPKIVDEKVFDFKVSSNGKYVTYINSDKQLILKEVDTDKTRIIKDKFGAKGEFEISPSGKTVAFAYKNSNEPIKTYLNTNGREKEIAKNMLPIVVSDDATKVFLMSESEDLYYLNLNKKRSKPIRLSEAPIGRYPIYFNNSLTEVVFSNSKGTYFFTEEGKGVKKIIDEEARIMIPKRKAESYSSVPDYKIILSTSSVLKNYFYCASNSIYYVDNIEHSKKLVDNATQAEITDNLDSLFYVGKDKNLHKLFKRDPEKKELLAKDCFNFMSNSSGTAYYYTNKDGELYYSFKGEDPKKIADKVFNAMLNKDGLLIYTTVDDSNIFSGSSYILKPGDKPRKISENSIDAFASGKLFAYFSPKYEGDKSDMNKNPRKYFNEVTYELYTSTNGVDFVKNENQFKPYN